MKKSLITFLALLIVGIISAQHSNVPEILVNRNVMKNTFLPDFSYAGYHFGEKDYPTNFDHVLSVVDFGAKANDGVDDSKAFIKALEKANELEGYVLIEIPPGTFHINEVIYINRSRTVLRGVGSGQSGTILHFQRPLRFVADPPEHEELMVYLEHFDKRQREPKNGIDTPFSQYSWSGGFLWVAKKGKMYKSYNIPEYNQAVNTYTTCSSGKQGGFKVEVKNADKLKVGDKYKLCWYNKDGEKGSLLDHMYDNQDVTIGEHHWNNPDNPLVSQMVEVTKVEKNTVYVKAPLLWDVKSEWHCSLVEWEHIEEVGIENIAFEFPISPDWPHHCEDGNNAIYLTSLMNGWVRNVCFKNADSGIITDDVSNVTIENATSYGDKISHYSVAMGEVHNVLVKDLRVRNVVRHPLSFNTRSTRCVYTNCVVETAPILDQHSGMNAQNLYDDIKVFIDAPVQNTYNYKLFLTGGSKRWAPGHGAFSTIFNIEVNFANIPADLNKPISLSGAKEGVSARIIGVHGNHPISIDYNPNAYIEKTNSKLSVTSLYDYQLEQRSKNNTFEGFLLMDESALEEAKKGVQSGDEKYTQAYAKLKADADEICQLPLLSVMDKSQTPPSGSKHDYMSLGRYWWPNPDTPDGLPYIRKDGVMNPEILDFDSKRVGDMMGYLESLSLAYYFSGNEKYAQRAILVLRTWFLDPATKMNPNLKFAQSIRGIVEGRGIGIIDTMGFAKIGDIMKMLSASPSLTAQVSDELKIWMGDYLTWIWSHPYGQDERNMKNNHGTAYDYQVVGLATYTGNFELAKNVLSDLRNKRIDTQIQPNGKQPLELERTNSFHYSVYNLTHLIDLAIMGEKYDIDLFNYVGTEGQSLSSALEYLVPFIGNEKNWEYQQLASFTKSYDTLYDMFSKMAFYTNNKAYIEAGQKIAKKSQPEYSTALTFPL